VQSGETVKTRMNSGVSPDRTSTRAFDAEVVKTRMDSGVSPFHRIAPVRSVK
jgi:hypothetical protein